MGNIESKQFKHAYWLKANENREDTLVVKELITYKDGRTEDNLKVIKNATRPYYITKNAYRNHKQKKEHELNTKVTEYRCTQSNLEKEALTRLKGSGYNGPFSRRNLNMSPYIYGSDINITELVKEKYDNAFDKVGKPKGLFTTTFFDIEYNIKKEETCILTSMRFNPKDSKEIEINVYVNNSENGIEIYNEDVPKIKEIMLKNFSSKLPKAFMHSMKFKFKFYFSEDVIEVLDLFWQNTHRDKSDFLTAWNVSYDIGQIEKEYEKRGEDFARRVTDPSLDDEYVEYRKKIVPDMVVTAGGVKKRIPTDRRWHTFRSPASFFIIDQMATYSYLRITDKTILGGYSLDNVLTKEGGLHKMNFPHLDKLDGLVKVDWHNTCLKEYPIEYACYNIWDVMLCLILEWKNKDLASTLPIFVNKSSFEDFDSSTKYVVNDFHFYALANDRVIGTMVPTENFGEGIGRRGWTVTLPPWPKYSARSGVMNGYIPYLADSSALLVGDTDVTAAYPNAQSFANISKDTTRCELMNIANLDNHKKWKEVSTNRIQKMKELNLTFFSGESSHIEYSEWMYDMPDSEEFLELAIEHFGIDYQRSDYELSKKHIESLVDEEDGANVIKVDDGKQCGAFMVRPSKIDESENSRYNFFNTIYKDGQLDNWDDFEDKELSSLKEDFDTVTNQYGDLSKMKSSDSIEMFFAKPLERLEELTGKSSTYKSSFEPKYRSMKNKDISETIGYVSSHNVNGGNVPDKGIVSMPDLDTMDSYEATPLFYGGNPRALGGTDSINKYKTKEMKKSQIIELL